MYGTMYIRGTGGDPEWGSDQWHQNHLGELLVCFLGVRYAEQGIIPAAPSQGENGQCTVPSPKPCQASHAGGSRQTSVVGSGRPAAVRMRNMMRLRKNRRFPSGGGSGNPIQALKLEYDRQERSKKVFPMPSLRTVLHSQFSCMGATGARPWMLTSLRTQESGMQSEDKAPQAGGGIPDLEE